MYPFLNEIKDLQNFNHIFMSFHNSSMQSLV